MIPNKKSVFRKVGETPIIPISIKLLVVFVLLLLLSNFSTNFINIQLNRRQVINLTNKILVQQLKELYSNSTNQFEIYSFSGNQNEAIKALESSSIKGMTNPNSLALGVKESGDILFCSAANQKTFKAFPDVKKLNDLNLQKKDGVLEGVVYFNTPNGQYLGVYKYQEDWQCFLIRAELLDDMMRDLNKTFFVVSIIIIVLTICFIILGSIMFSKILRFIKRMTDDLYKMQASQSLGLLDLKDAPNDDITYLGASFNSLSSTINNLLNIFQKFVSKDVVEKAYSEHTINLEGSQRELTILFSDIRGFTYRTETLGNDIINLLNIHYDRVIHIIHDKDGVIGSIIGDAVLGMYGTLNVPSNKSVCALESAWEITRVTSILRSKVIERHEDILKKRPLTESEEKIYKAVLLDVGVGLDGGKVFYGNIGSSEHMTNTVIGDNVNSASRLEGLTRVYHLPVIVSSYVKEEVEQVTDNYEFIEIDTVQVKGKTEGKKIYLPLEKLTTDQTVLDNYNIFSLALKSYYAGDWKKAIQLFEASTLEVASVFLERISDQKVPEDWSGIWTMTTK